jgi:hypothetical protein
MLGVKEFALGLLAGSLIAGTGSWYVQGLRIDKLKSEHEIFIQKTKSVGEIVQVKSDTITVTQEKAKEVADVDYKEDFNRLNSELKRLRNQRASTSYTPAATANSRSPDLACFDRTELEQAFRFLDAGISELTQEGDTNALRLSVGMKWASDLQKR